MVKQGRGQNRTVPKRKRGDSAEPEHKAGSRGSEGMGTPLKKLPSSLMEWLHSIGVLRSDEFITRASDALCLSEEDANRLRSGELIATVASQTLGLKSCVSSPELDILENWKLVLGELARYSSISCIADDGAAQALASGRSSLLVQLLDELHQAFIACVANSEILESTPVIAVSVTELDVGLVRQGARATTLGMLLLQSINSKLTPGLSLEDTAGLLSGGSTSYLRQLLLVGPKHNLRPVCEWLHTLYTGRELVAELMRSASSDDVAGFLRLIGQLLFAPDDVTQVKALAIIKAFATRLASEADERAAAAVFREAVDGVADGTEESPDEVSALGDRKEHDLQCQALWVFLRSSWALNGVLRAWQQCASARPVVCELLEAASRADKSSVHLSALFRVDLHSALPDGIAYIEFALDLIRLVDSGAHLQEKKDTLEPGDRVAGTLAALGKALSQRDIPKHLASFATRLSEPRLCTNARQASIGLLSQVWSTFTKDIERDPAVPKGILLTLNKAYRDSRSQTLQIFALATVFELLESFASQHKPFAPYLYKTAIFSLIEFHRQATLRDFILSNLAQSLRKMPFAPVGVLITPLVKQLTLHGFNNLDLEFLHTLARHPRLDIKDGIKLLDLVAKIALNDAVYSRSAADVLLGLAKRFALSQQMHKYLGKIFQAAAAMLAHQIRHSKHVQMHHSSSGLLGGGNGNSSTAAQQQANLHRMQVAGLTAEERNLRSQVLEVLTRVIALNNKSINEEVRLILERSNDLRPVADELVRLSARGDWSGHASIPHSFAQQHQGSLNLNHLAQPKPALSFEERLAQPVWIDAENDHAPSDDDNAEWSEDEQPVFGENVRDAGAPKAEGPCDPEAGQPDAKPRAKSRTRKQTKIKVQAADEALSPRSPAKATRKPKFSGLHAACALLDPCDTGFVDKVKFLGIVNGSPEDHPACKAIIDCDETRLCKDRKLQDSIRRLATERPGQIAVQQLDSLLRVQHQAKYGSPSPTKRASSSVSSAAVTTAAADQSSAAVDEVKKSSEDLQGAKLSKQVHTDAVIKEIERISRTRKEREAQESKADEEKRAAERERRAKTRRYYDKRIQEKRVPLLRAPPSKQAAVWQQQPASPKSPLALLQTMLPCEEHVGAALPLGTAGSLTESAGAVRSDASDSNDQVEGHVAVELAVIKSKQDVLRGEFHIACDALSSGPVLDFDLLRSHQNQLSLQQWLRFLRGHKLVPSILSQVDARKLFFRAAKTSAHQDNNTVEADFDQFLLALALIAATVPGFKEVKDGKTRGEGVLGFLRASVVVKTAFIIQEKGVESLFPSLRHLAHAWSNASTTSADLTEANSIDSTIFKTFNIHYVPIAVDPAAADAASADPAAAAAAATPDSAAAQVGSSNVEEKIGDGADNEDPKREQQNIDSTKTDSAKHDAPKSEVDILAERVLNALRVTAEVREKHDRVIPKDTRLYPQEQIEKRKASLLKKKKPAHHVVAFGSAAVIPDEKKHDLKSPVKPEGEDATGTAAAAFLSEAEVAFMERLKLSLEKEEHKKHEKVELARKKQEQLEKSQAAAKEAARKKRAQELRDIYAKQSAEKQAKAEQEAKAKEEKDLKMRQAEAKRKEIDAERRKRERLQIEEHNEKKRAELAEKLSVQEAAKKAEREKLRERFDKIQREREEREAAQKTNSKKAAKLATETGKPKPPSESKPPVPEEFEKSTVQSDTAVLSRGISTPSSSESKKDEPSFMIDAEEVEGRNSSKDLPPPSEFELEIAAENGGAKIPVTAMFKDGTAQRQLVAEEPSSEPVPEPAPK